MSLESDVNDSTRTLVTASSRKVAFKVAASSDPIRFRDYVKFVAGSDDTVTKATETDAFGICLSQRLSLAGDVITVMYLQGGGGSTGGASSSGDTLVSGTVNAGVLNLVLDSGAIIPIDVSSLLDDTNLSRTVSGAVDGSGQAVFTRDDNTTFTVDMSSFLDDTNLARVVSVAYIPSAFGTAPNLTFTRDDNTTFSVDLPEWGLGADIVSGFVLNGSTLEANLSGGGQLTVDLSPLEGTTTFERQTVNLVQNTPLTITTANISDIFSIQVYDASGAEIEVSIVKTANANQRVIESNDDLVGVVVELGGLV